MEINVPRGNIVAVVLSHRLVTRNRIQKMMKNKIERMKFHARVSSWKEIMIVPS